MSFMGWIKSLGIAITYGFVFACGFMVAPELDPTTRKAVFTIFFILLITLLTVSFTAVKDDNHDN